MPGTPGRRAMVRVPGAAVAVTAEACTNTGDNQTYRVTNTAHRVLDPTARVTVKVAGTATAEAYTLNRLTGTIVFATVNAGRGAVTIDGSYLPMASAARTRGYAWNLTGTNADDTDFDTANTDNGFTRRVQVLLDVSGTLSGKWSTDTYLRDALLNASVVLLEFFPDRALTRDLACWAILNKSGLTAAMDNVIDTDVEFQGTVDADGRAASL